jgi:hypothetical protein
MKQNLIVGVLAAFFVAIALTAPAFAFPYCLNSTWAGDSQTVAGQTIQQIEQCPFGCATTTGTCLRANGFTGITLETFVIVFILASVCLGFGFKRGPGVDNNGSPHGGSIGFPIIAMVLYLVLAFSGFSMEYISANGIIPYGTDIILIIVCYIFAFIALLDVLWNAFKTVND